MAIVSRTLDPLKPYRINDEERRRLDALTDDQITAAAESDPDNPPLTEAEFDRMDAARLARAARNATGLSQARFAETYRINVARLRDLEQGRFQQPDSALVAYLTVIRQEPDTVRRALGG